MCISVKTGGTQGLSVFVRGIRVLMSTQSKKPLALHDFDAWILETLQLALLESQERSGKLIVVGVR
jgi:hypothetical protein